MARLLSIGSTGPDVRELQAALNFHVRRPATGLEPDGAFGPLTEARVREFQRRAKLQVDGLVGADTIRALYRTVAGIVEATLTPRDRGPTRRESRGPAIGIASAPRQALLAGTPRFGQVRPVVPDFVPPSQRVPQTRAVTSEGFDTESKLQFSPFADGEDGDHPLRLTFASTLPWPIFLPAPVKLEVESTTPGVGRFQLDAKLKVPFTLIQSRRLELKPWFFTGAGVTPRRFEGLNPVRGHGEARLASRTSAARGSASASRRMAASSSSGTAQRGRRRPRGSSRGASPWNCCGSERAVRLARNAPRGGDAHPPARDASRRPSRCNWSSGASISRSALASASSNCFSTGSPVRSTSSSGSFCRSKRCVPWNSPKAQKGSRSPAGTAGGSPARSSRACGRARRGRRAAAGAAAAAVHRHRRPAVRPHRERLVRRRRARARTCAAVDQVDLAAPDAGQRPVPDATSLAPRCSGSSDRPCVRWRGVTPNRSRSVACRSTVVVSAIAGCRRDARPGDHQRDVARAAS